MNNIVNNSKLYTIFVKNSILMVMKKSLILITFSFLAVRLLAQTYYVGHKQFNFVDPARSRTIQTEVYYPATSAGDNTPFASGQFPVLVFGHGFVMSWDSYQWLWDSLTTKGYIMVFPRTEGSISPSHAEFGTDLKFLNDYVLSEGSNSSSFFYQHILGTSAIMGHSMGRGSSFLAAANNTNLTTLVNFAAAETNPSAIAAAANVTVPAVVFYGVNDGVAPPANHQIPMYNALASSCKTLIGIVGGGHCYFADYNFNCSFGEGTTNPQPTISREQQHEIVAQLLIPYLNYMLKGDASAEQIYYQRLNSMNTIVFQRNCLMNYDVALRGFVSPSNSCGLNANQTVSVIVKNNGINPVSNVPLSLVFNNQTPIQEIYTGTINPNDSIIYTFTQTVNAGQPGATYQFVVYSSYTNDEYIYNDTVSVSYTNTTVALPISVDFTGYDGTNLATVFPGWKEAQGIVPTGNTSAWVSRTGIGGTTNVTAKVNFYSSPIREWILGPGFLCGPYTKLSFDVAVTAYNSNNAYVNGMGTNDSLKILYSTDCGATWKRLTAYGKNANFTNALQTIEINLSSFNGQGIAIAFEAFRETTVSNDYDLHLDNILIKNYAPYDLVAESFVSPIEQNCFGTESVEVTIKNNGLNAIDFSVNPVTIDVQVTGVVNQMLTYQLTSGNLASQASMNQMIGTIDMSQNGNYTFTQRIYFTLDDDTTNNDLSHTVTVSNPELSIQGNTQICSGQSTTLTAQANVTGMVSLISSNSTSVSIPDNNSTGITSNITVSNISSSLMAANVLKKVIIDSLTHTYVGDLKIDLIAPDNSTINLVNQRGSSGDNFIGTIFDPTATTPISSITSANAPFTGSYRPENNFNMLTGPALGTWKLKVSDLASSDVGVLHKWTLVLEVNNYIVSYSWSNGQTTPDITVSPSQNTTYTLTITDAKGCTKTDSLSVNVGQTSNMLNLGQDIVVCEGQIVTLDAGNGFSSYLWNTGATTPTIQVTTSGTYSVQVSDACGTQDDTVVVTINPKPIVNLGPDVNICLGNSATLTAPANLTYNWSTGENTQAITVTPAASGTYTYMVMVSDANSCVNSDTIDVHVFDLPTVELGADTSICHTDQLTLSAGNFAQYSWSNGSTSSTLTVDANQLQNGAYTYAVTVTDNLGCTATDQITITIVTCNEINDFGTNQIMLYPNPATVEVFFDGLTLHSTIIIMSEDGKVVYQNNNIETTALKIDISQWSSGIYFVKSINEPMQTYTFIKR
ncbi:MAG: proprotein convertase P-domain-containing protein [Bacteroidales bacterium]|nr:proprotein convertase P-domain-containing protein [Bacteroidales bacterium]